MVGKDLTLPLQTELPLCLKASEARRVSAMLYALGGKDRGRSEPMKLALCLPIANSFVMFECAH